MSLHPALKMSPFQELCTQRCSPACPGSLPYLRNERAACRPAPRAFESRQGLGIASGALGPVSRGHEVAARPGPGAGAAAGPGSAGTRAGPRDTERPG